MSPVSSRKCSERGARVQAPFTLSDTWTSPEAAYSENHPTSRSPWATGAVSVTVVAEIGAVENAAPWTKVGVIDWAPAVPERRTPSAAIAPDRAAGKCFTVIHSLTKTRGPELPRIDSTPCAREVAFRVASNRRAGTTSPPSRAAPHAFRGADTPADGPVRWTLPRR